MGSKARPGKSRQECSGMSTSIIASFMRRFCAVPKNNPLMQRAAVFSIGFGPSQGPPWCLPPSSFFFESASATMCWRYHIQSREAALRIGWHQRRAAGAHNSPVPSRLPQLMARHQETACSCQHWQPLLWLLLLMCHDGACALVAGCQCQHQLLGSLAIRGWCTVVDQQPHEGLHDALHMDSNCHSAHLAYAPGISNMHVALCSFWFIKSCRC